MAAGSGESWQLNVTGTTITVQNLEPYSTYSVSIAAINAAGIGPYSIPIEVLTDESGTCVLIQQFVYSFFIGNLHIVPHYTICAFSSILCPHWTDSN